MSGDKTQDAAVQRWDHGRTREVYRQLGTNVYQTKDGRWYQLHGSMDPTALLKMLEMPQHDDKGLDFMGIVQVYQDVIKNWDSELLDDWSNNVYRTPGTICYEVEEFAALPHVSTFLPLTLDENANVGQGIALKNEPWYNVIKQEYFSQPPVSWPTTTDPDDCRPLAGIKILDLSRAIAAPTVSRVCAALGATVIRISSEVNTELPLTLIDGCTAKISVDLNLKTFEGRKKLMELIKDADIFVDGYRPSVLEHLGFGRDAVLGLCAKRPRGIIYVQENCYGWKGPWTIRPGWAQIADTVSPKSNMGCPHEAIDTIRYLESAVISHGSTVLMRHIRSPDPMPTTCKNIPNLFVEKGTQSLFASKQRILLTQRVQGWPRRSRRCFAGPLLAPQVRRLLRCTVFVACSRSLPAQLWHLYRGATRALEEAQRRTDGNQKTL